MSNNIRNNASSLVLESGFRTFTGFVYAAIISALFGAMVMATQKSNMWIFIVCIFLAMDYFSRSQSLLLIDNLRKNNHKVFKHILLVLEICGVLFFAVVAMGLAEFSEKNREITPVMFAVFVLITAVYNWICLHIDPLETGQYLCIVFAGNITIYDKLCDKWQKGIFEWADKLILKLEKSDEAESDEPKPVSRFFKQIPFYSLKALTRIYYELFALHFLILNAIVGIFLIIKFYLPNCLWPFGYYTIIFFIISFGSYFWHAHQKIRDDVSQQVIQPDWVDGIGNIALLVFVTNIYCSLSAEHLLRAFLIQQLIIAFIVFLFSTIPPETQKCPILILKPGKDKEECNECLRH